MSEEFKFNIGDEAVKTIIDLRDREPGDKEYALFLQIDGVHGNQFTYDLSFLDINQARSDDKRIDFGDLVHGVVFWKLVLVCSFAISFGIRILWLALESYFGKQF